MAPHSSTLAWKIPWMEEPSTGVGCYFFLQEIFPSQGLNTGLPHCRQTLYHLSHQGSPPNRGAGTQIEALKLTYS